MVVVDCVGMLKIVPKMLERGRGLTSICNPSDQSTPRSDDGFVREEAILVVKYGYFPITMKQVNKELLRPGLCGRLTGRVPSISMADGFVCILLSDRNSPLITKIPVKYEAAQ